MTLIEDGKYFVLHAQRQSGKTSFLIDLQDYLNSLPQYAAVYFNVERAQPARDDFSTGNRLVVDALRDRLKEVLGTDFDIDRRFPGAGGSLLASVLIHVSSALHEQGKRLVLLLDEVDSLQGDTLLSVLRYDM